MHVDRDVSTCLLIRLRFSTSFYVPGLIVDLEEMHTWNPRLFLFVGSHNFMSLQFRFTVALQVSLLHGLCGRKLYEGRRLMR